MTTTSKKLSKEQQTALLATLQKRFEKHMHRHKGLTWASVEVRLKGKAAKLWSLAEMERTGGEPDVVLFNKKAAEYTFVDCATESPIGRRSLCFDAAALKARKENKPEGSAEAMAATMGTELLSETMYRALQKIEAFDLKTSSWVATPADVRKLGGALFCDRRYDTVFTYHNGAESYYSGRAFRVSLTV